MRTLEIASVATTSSPQRNGRAKEKLWLAWTVRSKAIPNSGSLKNGAQALAAISAAKVGGAIGVCP